MSTAATFFEGIDRDPQKLTIVPDLVDTDDPDGVSHLSGERLQQLKSARR